MTDNIKQMTNNAAIDLAAWQKEVSEERRTHIEEVEEERRNKKTEAVVEAKLSRHRKSCKTDCPAMVEMQVKQLNLETVIHEIKETNKIIFNKIDETNKNMTDKFAEQSKDKLSGLVIVIGIILNIALTLIMAMWKQ